MTREQYEALSVVALKEIAKNRGIRHISALKKREVSRECWLRMPRSRERLLRQQKPRFRTAESQGGSGKEEPSGPASNELSYVRKRQKRLRRTQGNRTAERGFPGRRTAGRRAPGRLLLEMGIPDRSSPGMTLPETIFREQRITDTTLPERMINITAQQRLGSDTSQRQPQFRRQAVC